MLNYVNLLGEETVKNTSGVGGWTADNGTVARLWRGSPVPTELGATVYFNATAVTASASGNVTVETEHVDCAVGVSYRAMSWVGQGASVHSFKIGINFYDGSGGFLDSAESEYDLSDVNTWNLIATAGSAPSDGKMALYITAEDMAGDEVFGVSWPCLLNTWSFGSTTLSYVLDNLPDYLLDADDEIGWPVVYPLRQFVNVLTAQMQDTADDIEDWDYTRAVDADDGVAVLSTLGDPVTIESAALPWLAQLVGTKLRPTGGRGLTPWTVLEEGSVPKAKVKLDWDGWEGKTWKEIEEYCPIEVDLDSQYRYQVATAFNGIYHGQTASVKNYLAQFLVSLDPDDVVISKHHDGYAYLVLITIPESEDGGQLGVSTLAEIAQDLMPIGVSCEVEYA